MSLKDLPEPTRLVEDDAGVGIPPADVWISLLLILATLAAYWRVFGYGFVGFDDPGYVYNNLHLREGDFSRNLQWIFLSFDPDNWFPVTRISLLLDYKLFGARAGIYHAENVAIHCLAALLLFGFLRQATRARWPSAFVALVFALHPLHVESVAWIAERKDVLCAFFWFATLWAWTRYVRRPSSRRYLAALLLFILGLMAKPMIVTLPVLLLLLDYWPFGRKPSWKLIVEKIPFAAISCAVMVITIVAQTSAGAIQTLNHFPPGLRLENAVITVAMYLADTLWPAHLWAAYSYPRSLPLWQVLWIAAGIATISAVVSGQLRHRAYLAVGWFWFLATLLPVIGIVQVGLQARADRYMYVPIVGLAIALAWGIQGFVVRWPQVRQWAVAAGTIACVAMAIRTSLQTEYWSDSEVLFQHAIDMDSGNYLAWNYLGQSMSGNAGGLSQAIARYRKGLELRPEDAALHNNLASALCDANQLEEGIAEYREAIQINPIFGPMHAGLGNALVKAGRENEAIEEFETALWLDPRFAPAHNDLGTLLRKVPGRSAEGLRHLEIAAELNPLDALQQYNLGQSLLSTPNRLEESIGHFNKALEINPRLAEAHLGLARYYLGKGLALEAMSHLKAALRYGPNPNVQRIVEQLEQGQTVRMPGSLNFPGRG